VVIKPILLFAPPTPEDGAIINSSYAFINVTSDEPLKTAILEWNGKNLTMTMASNTSWCLNVTNLKSGTYTFRVWGKDSQGNWGLSETRKITVKLPRPKTPSRSSPYNTLITLSYVWTTWFLNYHAEFIELYDNATTMGISNKTLQKALELDNNATGLILDAWRAESLEEVKTELWKYTKIEHVPRLWEIREAYLTERKALEILKKVLELS
jgi:hypothetical protein